MSFSANLDSAAFRILLVTYHQYNTEIQLYRWIGCVDCR